MTREMREQAQDKIIDAIVAAALREEENGDEHLADAIRVLGARLAKSYGLRNMPGLPTTFETPDHER